MIDPGAKAIGIAERLTGLTSTSGGLLRRASTATCDGQSSNPAPAGRRGSRWGLRHRLPAVIAVVAAKEDQDR